MGATTEIRRRCRVSERAISLYEQKIKKIENSFILSIGWSLDPLFTHLFVGSSVGFAVGPSVGWGVGLFVGDTDGDELGLQCEDTSHMTKSEMRNEMIKQFSHIIYEKDRPRNDKLT